MGDEASVILVDEQDNPIGFSAKLAAHQNGGMLHRAFSVFIYDGAGKMLLQRRASTKYHFGGLWTNACCSHPRPGEALLASAQLRLQAEFGFISPLREVFTFIYKATDPASGLTEHELDHVLVGAFSGEPVPDPAEIEAWKWMSVGELFDDVRRNPALYTPWFLAALPRVLEATANGAG